jgi:hypothetical protein
VREESHLDDMRVAIRGDFERLAQRRGTQELMLDASSAHEPEPEARSEVEATAQEVDRRSWLRRLRSR